MRLGSSSLSSSGTIRAARTLPSSTPHWSNESMFQIDALREDAVLVQRDERAEHVRRQHLGEDHVGRAIALHHAVRDDPFGRALGAHLLLGLAERERFGLREDVRRQDVVMFADRVQRLAEPDEIDGDELRALVDQLVEAVLPVRARLTPVDGAGLVVDVRALDRDVLAVRLHRQLLQVGREPLQVLLVGHHARRSARRRSRRTRPRAGP